MKPHLPEAVWRCSETRPFGTAGQIAPSMRTRLRFRRLVFNPTLAATETVVTGW